MKIFVSLFLCFYFFAATGNTVFAAAASSLDSAMPLLQASTRTPAQTQKVLQLFVSAKEDSTVFAAGASLVRLPPPPVQEAKLFNVLLKDSGDLKKVFAAVILTAMGTSHDELSPLLQEATASADHAVRAYAAAAYTILNPQQSSYTNEIVNLYIYDPAFAARAMNLLSSSQKQTFKYIKAASQSSDSQVRAAAASWLADLQTQEAAKQLLNMAKTENTPEVMSAIATALAKNRAWTLDEIAKKLSTNYRTSAATIYTLALGFMPGYSIDILKQNLTGNKINARINAARASAYMAGVLGSQQADIYTQDKTFDISLLKGLIPALSTLARQGNPTEQEYAQTALTQIAKLK